jgi:S-DNA-T family DNA segregation ATPase FtsK/SpoIIIE
VVREIFPLARTGTHCRSMRPLHSRVPDLACSSSAATLALAPSASHLARPAGHPAPAAGSALTPVRPAPFDVVVQLCPDGRPQRFTVAPESPADRVGDLAAALGAAGADHLVIDGRSVDLETPLLDSGVVNGSVVEMDPSQSVTSRAAAPGTPPAVIEVAGVAGPDCQPWFPLGAGRHVIGRSVSARICLDDPLVELHHALIEVDDEEARLTQLTGHTPLRVDGEPLGTTRQLVLPATITLGASELRLRSASAQLSFDADGDGCQPLDCGTLVDAPADPWRRVVHRSPDWADPPERASIAVPSTATVHRIPPVTGLVGAGVAALGAVGLAIVMGQPMFALFAAIGAVVSAATWLAGAAAAWRSNRRERRLAAAERIRFLADLERERRVATDQCRTMSPAVEQAIGTAMALARPNAARSDVWRRRIEGSEDATVRFRVVIGRGDNRWDPSFDRDLPADCASAVECATRLRDLAHAVDLGTRDVVAVSGERWARHAVIRSMLCQLAVRHGPADWRLVVVSADPVAWGWTAWLPHTHSPSAQVPILDPTDEDGLGVALGAATPHGSQATVLFVEDPSLFALRTGPVRRLIERIAPLTLTCLEPNGTAPAMTRTIVTVGPTGRIDVSTMGEAPALSSDRGVQMCGVSLRSAEQTARALARLIDPEDGSTVASRLPVDVALSEVDPLLAAACAVCTDVEWSEAVSAVGSRWQRSGRDSSPRTAVGKSGDGIVEIDLLADGPHALIAGTTGAGKSELLRSLVAGLALRHSPDDLTFVLVDYKGGSTFDRCAELPHTVGVVTDLDAGLAERALISLDAELHRREWLLRSVGAADLADFRRHADVAVLPRLVVVIDEFAALAKELPDFLAALIGVAQRGRSLGIHLVLATQRPAGVVNDDIRANTNLRLALRLNDTGDARDVVDDVAPADFARDAPGRAALRLGPGELVVFQAARCLGPPRRQGRGLRVAHSRDCAHETAVESDQNSELDVAVRLAADAFQELSLAEPHRPWVDALPDRLTCASIDIVADAVDHGGVGVVDDPAHQCWRVLRWDREAGNLALIGGLGSGTTSTLRAIIVQRCRRRPVDLEHWYLIDARGESTLDELSELAHVGAIIRVHETERLHRVLMRLALEIDRRATTAPDEWCVSLAIDGLQPLRTALSSIDHAPTLALLERVLSEGPAVGVMTCWTDAGASSSLRASAQTWVFRCEHADVAREVGVTPIDDVRPGRLRIATSGLEALVAVDAGRVAVARRSATWGVSSTRPEPVEVLPDRVRATAPTSPSGGTIDAALDLDIGLAYGDLAVSRLRVPVGDHVFIGGAASTGKTTALHQVVAAWRSVHPAATVIWVDRQQRFAVDGDGCSPVAPVLIAVDDAERVDDPDGHLAAIAAAGRPGVTIVAAGRLEAVRSAYGHWTRAVARSRCGVILTSVGDVDGDLLGVSLPRRSPIRPRPGLAWVVDGSGHRLVQVFDPQPLDALPRSQRGPAPY